MLGLCNLEENSLKSIQSNSCPPILRLSPHPLECVAREIPSPCVSAPNTQHLFYSEGKQKVALIGQLINPLLVSCHGVSQLQKYSVWANFNLFYLIQGSEPCASSHIYSTVLIRGLKHHEFIIPRWINRSLFRNLEYVPHGFRWFRTNRNRFVAGATRSTFAFPPPNKISTIHKLNIELGHIWMRVRSINTTRHTNKSKESCTNLVCKSMRM